MNLKKKASMLPSRHIQPKAKYKNLARCIFFIQNTLAFIIFPFAEVSSASESNRWIDYHKYEHSLKIKSFRAGVHDEDGENEYFFQLKMIAKPLNVESKSNSGSLKSGSQDSDKKGDKKKARYHCRRRY